MAVEHLVGALDRPRATFRWKADGLDAVGLQTRVGASVRVRDLIEEYGRHTGHADLPRQGVDGLGAEDLRRPGGKRPAKHA